MAKKEQYYVLAEQYYVEEQLSVAAVARKLNITEKTLHNWRKDGGWDEKRSKFLKSKYNCYSSLYELTNRITQQILSDYEADGTIPEKSALAFLGKMIDKLPKMKKLEAQEIIEKAEENDERTDESLALKVAELVDKKLMGE